MSPTRDANLALAVQSEVRTNDAPSVYRIEAVQLFPRGTAEWLYRQVNAHHAKQAVFKPVRAFPYAD
jgi:hypothetical protein